MTREEAIQKINELGYYAKPRDWALGKTILLSREQPNIVYTHDYEIETLPGGVLYLYPDKESPAAWNLIDNGTGYDRLYDSLESAVVGIHIYLSQNA